MKQLKHIAKTLFFLVISLSLLTKTNNDNIGTKNTIAPITFINRLSKVTFILFKKETPKNSATIIQINTL